MEATLEPDSYIQQNDGNSRMVVTTLNLKAGPVSIINCYLPSGNKPEAEANFREDIDCINVLLEQLGATHDVLLNGDLNQDHFHRNSPKERLNEGSHLYTWTSGPLNKDQ